MSYISKIEFKFDHCVFFGKWNMNSKSLYIQMPCGGSFLNGFSKYINFIWVHKHGYFKAFSPRIVYLTLSRTNFKNRFDKHFTWMNENWHSEHGYFVSTMVSSQTNSAKRDIKMSNIPNEAINFEANLKHTIHSVNNINQIWPLTEQKKWLHYFIILVVNLKKNIH